MPSDTTILDAFAATDLFGSLNKRTIKRIAASATPVQHAAGKAITTQGEGGIGLHLILEGTATVSVNGEVVDHLGPGNYFGEISLIDGSPRSATVVADTDMQAAALSAWQFKPLLDEVPGLAKNLLLVMCERLRKAQAKDIVITA
jgi:CRP-like cAMP-binding protein